MRSTILVVVVDTVSNTTPVVDSTGSTVEIVSAMSGEVVDCLVVIDADDVEADDVSLSAEIVVGKTLIEVETDF